MITTNRNDYKKDLEEVIYMFSSGEDVDIVHTESNDGFNFKNTFTFKGNTYSFENQKLVNGDLELKRYEKRFSKLGLYKILKEHYKIDYAWGALTGIRPTKMAYSIGENYKEELKDVFLVTDKKISLVEDILKTQEGILDVNGEYADFFVGIPFCPSRCAYCSFISEEIGKSKYVNEYVDVLVKEINASINLTKNVRSIYIGGGTPICLDENSLIKILSALKPLSDKVKEFTVEAGRPDVITKEKLQILKDYGVTRICVNPQTFSNKTLELIGRKHSSESVIEKYNIAKQFGFSINTDIIAGLISETFEDFKNTVDTVIKLDPDNFTVHTLCLKKGSKLKEKISRLSSSEIVKMTDYAYLKAKQNGYNPYYLYRQKYAIDNLENTGYAKKGKECIYNIDVMEETSSNVACGANAVSKRVFPTKNLIERYGAPKDIYTYINKIDEIIKCKKELFL